MRSTGLFLVIGFGLIGVAACTTDTTPSVYAAVAYQIRCLNCEPAGPDDAAHEIKVVNGEDGYNADCAVRRVDGTRRVTFSVGHIDSQHSSTNHAFKISSGNLDSDDTELSAEVQIIEGANTYIGGSSGQSPDASGGPCQATFSVKDGVIKGGVYCSNIPNSANLSTTRYLVAPNTRTDPAQFEIHGCSGL
jgi:hypothetical protein